MSPKRDFRPRFHFTAPTAWINDPNGLVRIGETYHMFCQYDPWGSVGGKHWYHAISDDLIRWTHLPVALSPDNLGHIFSGSAVLDSENRSGFGSEEHPPLIALYTSHGETEQQSIAYSLDGVHFTKYADNPVIPNPGLVDFRDPKLFWNPIRTCWSMVLAATDRVFFYATDDFIHWEKTGEFGAENNPLPGVWECPDMIPFTTAAGTCWVLIGSMTHTADTSRANMQYFIGDFDGNTFTCFDDENKISGGLKRVDEGFDHYAGVTFNHTDSPLYMAWALHWDYAQQTPTGVYRGQLTLPQTLQLVETPKDGLRLAGEPVGIAAYLGDEKALPNKSATDCESFYLRVEGQGCCAIAFSNACGQILQIGVDEANNLYLNRAKAGQWDFHTCFADERHLCAKAARFYDGAYRLEIYFDVSIAEIYIDQGTRRMTTVVYPDAPYDTLTAQGDVRLFFRAMTEPTE